jgi:putative tributyrin esterase
MVLLRRAGKGQLRMSVLNVRFYSEALGKQTSFNVIHPDQGDGPYAVLMQLHGLSDDSFTWLSNSNLVRHVAPYPMIVVLPDGGTSRYLNVPLHDRYGKQRYEDLLVTDIPAQMERTFQVRSGPWAIGGLSMGGYGALRLGMKHSARFASIWAHSSGLAHPGQEWLDLLDDPEDASVLVQAERLKVRLDAGERGPVISFDCGVDDELIGPNRELHAHLDAIGLDHHYAEHPGAHEWDYWDQHVREALAQHARVLGMDAAD